MSGICLDCEPLLSTSDMSFGFTKTAVKFLDLFNNNNHTLSATAPARKTEDILSELIEIHKECSEDNWDDEGALTISTEALFEAVTFLRMLPYNLTLPDVVPSSNGAFDFEWRKNGSRLNVELSGVGEIVYSAYFSRLNRDYGQKPYVEKIPKNLIELIKSIN